jgi:hypothetical protein
MSFNPPHSGRGVETLQKFVTKISEIFAFNPPHSGRGVETTCLSCGLQILSCLYNTSLPEVIFEDKVDFEVNE